MKEPINIDHIVKKADLTADRDTLIAGGFVMIAVSIVLLFLAYRWPGYSPLTYTFNGATIMGALVLIIVALRAFIESEHLHAKIKKLSK